MAEPLKGLHASVKFEEITEFNWTDDKGQQKPIRNIVGLMDHGDGTVTRVQLGFPRDPRWRAKPAPPIAWRSTAKPSLPRKTTLTSKPASTP